MKHVYKTLLFIGVILNLAVLQGCKKTKIIPTPTLSFAQSSITGVSGNNYDNAATSSVADGGAITYTVDKPGQATLNTTTGRIKPLVPGVYIITATQAAVTDVNQQATATYTLTVVDPTSNLTFAQPSYTITTKYATEAITAVSSIANSGAITYSIDNTNIATINPTSGLIVPIMAGTVTITATQAALRGVNQQATATCQLIITDPLPMLTFATPTNFSAALGSKTLANIATSSITAGGTISYTIDKSNIATVNSTTGIITTLALGTATVTATQAPRAKINAQATATYTLTVAAPELTLNVTTVGASYFGGGSSIQVKSNGEWTAASNASWCTISTSDELPGVCTINCATNTSTSSRSAVVTVTGLGGITKTVAVTQAGYPPNPSITLTYSFAGSTSSGVNIRTGTLNASNSWNFPVAVSSNIHWTVKTDPNASWCNATGSAMGNGTVTITVSVNSNYAVARSAVIQVIGSMGTPIATITVIQS